MKYSFTAIASRAAVSALLSAVVSTGSAIPAAAAQSATASAAPSHDASIAGPVHPITEILYESI